MNGTAYRMVLVAALVVCIAVAGIFATRAVHYAKQTGTGLETIRPWMSVPYIAHSKHVPQGVLWKALGIPAHTHDRRPLARIAREQGRPVEELIAAVRNALAHAPSQGSP